MYNNTVVSTSYDDPGAATYVVVGTGGNREGNENGDNFSHPEPWSAANSLDVGFAMMSITNSSLEWNFFSSYENQVIDQFTITK